VLPNDLKDLGVKVDGINIRIIVAGKVHPLFGEPSIVELFPSKLGLALKDGMIVWGYNSMV